MEPSLQAERTMEPISFVVSHRLPSLDSIGSLADHFDRLIAASCGGLWGRGSSVLGGSTGEEAFCPGFNGGGGGTAGGGCDSTRIDHKTCTSSYWQDLTSS
ncbi:hypothetical protein Taro_015799 [Colocasia esculenta]|uniref:Uncharacterized protein n=1 Tax=Colocasia esculenta TaxID=4460 RepID=A0A843UQY8_COLES|nr:hypothetical protein [Colocasia esculenta]